MRCDNKIAGVDTKGQVSIHTPTWGVTLYQVNIGSASSVSIHTPTWGVTLYQVNIGSASSVSIHTPTWGVTLYQVNIGGASSFQSTHLHEVWQHQSGRGSTTTSFNPHTYMRCDCRQDLANSFGDVSIHTPTWGVTWFFEILLWQTVSFNPHTYMRCDSPFRGHFALWERFNPHTYMRCDVDVLVELSKDSVSIHTPTWGVTAPHQEPVFLKSFNPHTYMRCDNIQRI